MSSINVTNARKELYRLIEKSNEIHEPVHIIGKNGSVSRLFCNSRSTSGEWPHPKKARPSAYSFSGLFHPQENHFFLISSRHPPGFSHVFRACLLREYRSLLFLRLCVPAVPVRCGCQNRIPVNGWRSCAESYDSSRVY